MQSIRALSLGLHPDSSPLGIAWLAITFVMMVGLARGKSRVGAKLKNPVIVAEAQVTMVDAYLAAAVLVGIGLNATLGWWWADPVAGLVIVFYGLREGRHAWVEARGIPA